MRQQQRLWWTRRRVQRWRMVAVLVLGALLALVPALIFLVR